MTIRAQNELLRFDHALNTKSLPNLKYLDNVRISDPFQNKVNVDYGSFQENVQRVVSILRNNIKQWSFVESQLLEPNVNVAMVSFIT